MPTVIDIDGVAHMSHPDEDAETFCGESFNYDTDDVASYALYADSALSQFLATHDADVSCEECVRFGEDWGTPEEEQ